LGFTDQMSDWMAAADAMIHATAGLTVLEAHIRGCPVISYGFQAGHLRANNAAFERFGIAEVVHSEHELESVLRHVSRERRPPDSSFASLPSIASRALAVRPRVRPQAAWRWRTSQAATGIAVAFTAVALFVGISLAADWLTPYRDVVKVARPVTSRIHFGTEPAAEGNAGPKSVTSARPRRERSHSSRVLVGAPTVEEGARPR
ncbi:MAG: hypothetical protein JST08_20240, partial [Actinobacteria bacterium]|nr:hypothetical protein [Actinomycetota bacterium]